MSSYAGIYVNGKEVFTYRNEVFPEIMYLFADDDYAFLVGDDAQPYASNWHVHGDDEEVEVHIFRTRASVLRERLNVLGFGNALTRRVVEGLVQSEIEHKARMLDYAVDAGIHEAVPEVQEQLASWKHFDSEEGPHEVATHLAEKQRAPKPDWRNMGCLGLFEMVEQRVLLRVIFDHVADDAELVLDVYDLVDGGYFGQDAEQQPWWPSWDLGPGAAIVITEGSYDAWVLSNAIEILRPHLSRYVRFLDYEVGNEGGAAAAVRMLKSFAAAGISNRIVAMFDNDSAAYEAVTSLSATSLPPHFSVLHYPDCELARSYPTLGPQGSVPMDVNRLAASIELYLGSDILRTENGELTPVQWKGYMAKVKAYQGEVMNKGALQRAFSSKVQAARSNPASVAGQDWSGLQSILDALVERLSSLSTTGSGPVRGADVMFTRRTL